MSDQSNVNSAPEPSKDQVANAFGPDVAERFEQAMGRPKPLATLTPANPDIFVIARLYLEKYEALADEDRELYRQLISIFANPFGK